MKYDLNKKRLSNPSQHWSLYCMILCWQILLHIFMVFLPIPH